ncbi:hypothetical protein L0337_24650 [candidate division KSB1 bacterium]|nr:hypothetical protein [candidate division KSB1 bacterium]
MPKKTNKSSEPNKTAELLRDLITIQLSLAGVGQREIRSIVGGNMNRINGICKMLRPYVSRSRKEGK